MNQQEGIEVTGEFSPFLRFCIGTSLLILAIGKTVHWLLPLITG